jgi:hypothetical protein
VCEEESENMMKGVCNELKLCGYLYGGGEQNLKILEFFWSNSKKTSSFSVQTVKFVFKRSNLNSNG